MSITLQALQADGTWSVRNAFATENAKVRSGAMSAGDLEAQARTLMAQWQSAYPDGKRLRVHNSNTDKQRADVARKNEAAPTKSAVTPETSARALGWLTEEEAHGVNDHHGVVHPKGRWAPDWQSACADPVAGSLFSRQP